MRNALWAMIGMMALTAASGAQAQKPDVEEDLRCVALLAAAIPQADAEKRANLVTGVLYFIGRLDGKAPGLDLETELRRVFSGLTQVQAVTEGQRCGTILIEKGQLLQSVGAALQTKK